MARQSPTPPRVERFADYQRITPANPLRHAVCWTRDSADDLVVRAEKALDELSGEFDGWMQEEYASLMVAYDSVVKGGASASEQMAFYRAVHDLRGAAGTFGYAIVAEIAANLCRIIEHTPAFDEVPVGLIGTHVNAIGAIVRECKPGATARTAVEISAELREQADEFLAALEAPDAVLIEAPAASLAPRA